MIYPVLLCGGSGTRLWPLSRESHPKQFAALLGSQTLLQGTAARLRGPAFAAPLVSTHADFRFIARRQLADIGIEPDTVLLEPSRHNTAASALAAALHLAARDPDALMLLAPADHVILADGALQACIARAADVARAGHLVTFGIPIRGPETGFGYLECAPGPATLPGDLHAVVRFVEKPPVHEAEALIATGRAFWNAGIFLCTAATLIAAFRAHCPDMIAPVTEALATARTDLGNLRLAPEPWDGLPVLSLDHAVMERAARLAVVPFDGDWSDVGDWETVRTALVPDADGVTCAGAATALDCADTLLHVEDDAVALVGLGLRDIVAVATRDAVLVADRRRSQDVRLAVAALSAEGRPQARATPRDHRPWGWFETLSTGPGFCIKTLHVLPGEALSLQSHEHRAEHWTVVTGTARVTLEAEVHHLGPQGSIAIPPRAVHRLENPGQAPLTLIEVQTGSYLGEDDIHRYADRYARV